MENQWVQMFWGENYDIFNSSYFTINTIVLL